MDKFGFRRHAGNFLAQVLDVAINGPIADNPLIRVDMVHKLGSTEYAPGVFLKEAQQFEFDHGKFQISAVQQRLETLLVQMKHGSRL